jgi:kinetochore protein Mis13/DSN1
LKPLSEAQREILRAAQEDVIQMMATRKIEVGSEASLDNSNSRSNILAGLEDSATVGVENEKGKGKDVGENEQNVKNKAREQRFGAFIERWVVYVFVSFFRNIPKLDINSSHRVIVHVDNLISAKAEESAWLEVANFYNSYRANILDELEKSSSLVSAKSRGKRRAIDELAEQGGKTMVREDELPAAFRGEGVGLARNILAEGVGVEKGEGRMSPLSERLQGLEFKVLRTSLIFSFIWADILSRICTDW